MKSNVFLIINYLLMNRGTSEALLWNAQVDTCASLVEGTI